MPSSERTVVVVVEMTERDAGRVLDGYDAIVSGRVIEAIKAALARPTESQWLCPGGGMLHGDGDELYDDKYDGPSHHCAYGYRREKHERGVFVRLEEPGE